VVSVEGTKYTVVTPGSPLGKSILGKVGGEEFTTGGALSGKVKLIK